MFKVDISLSLDGGAPVGHVFSDLEAKDVRHLGDHFLQHAMQKVNAMMPDDFKPTGTRNVTSAWTLYGEDGTVSATQSNTWDQLGDTEVGAIKGAYDDAIAKLNKQLASHGKRK